MSPMEGLCGGKVIVMTITNEKSKRGRRGEEMKKQKK